MPSAKQEQQPGGTSRKPQPPPGEGALVAHLPKVTRTALGGEGPKPHVANGMKRERQASASPTVRKMLCNRNNTDTSAVIAASQTANAVFTTQPGAAPTRRSRSGRKFHVVMCT